MLKSTDLVSKMSDVKAVAIETARDVIPNTIYYSGTELVMAGKKPSIMDIGGVTGVSLMQRFISPELDPILRQVPNYAREPVELAAYAAGYNLIASQIPMISDQTKIRPLSLAGGVWVGKSLFGDPLAKFRLPS